MKEGQGFAHRITAANLRTFSPLLRKTAVPTESSSSTRSAGKKSAKEIARFRKADRLFRGRSLKLKLPFQKPASQSQRTKRQPLARQLGKIVKSAPVLVAEIHGPSRWKQANFNLENFVNFFQCDPKQRKEVSLTRVDQDGNTTVERHPSVAVKSSNFRIELGAASGLSYPAKGQGRPIGVFIRTATRKFLYRLLMPPDRDYATVSGFLNRNTSPQRGRMRRLRIGLADLKRFWPRSPLLTALRTRQR
jgi:hypothetical protein